MATRPRGGAQVPRSQFVVRPTYEDFEPKFDEKEEPTAYILHVYLPGFAREHLKVTYDDSTKKIRARGERPLGNYKWSRFEKEFNIPNSCMVSQIKGKFEKNILIITMPKKVIVTQVASQEPEATKKATQEAATASPPAPAPAPAELKKVVEEKVVPPKATSSAPAIEKTKEVKPAAAPPSPKKATAEPKSQKGKQNSPQKPTSTDKNTVEPISPLPLPPPSQVITSQTRPQKVEDQSPPKPTSKRTHKSVEQKAKEEEKTPEKKSKEPEMEKSDIQDPSEKKRDATGGYQEKAESSGAKRSKEERDMGASAKEVLGKLAKRVKEDENSKQLLINAGVAAVVIVALGAYIAYTIGSGETKN